jgi:hypothetical protein
MAQADGSAAPPGAAGLMRQLCAAVARQELGSEPDEALVRAGEDEAFSVLLGLHPVRPRSRAVITSAPRRLPSPN